MMPRVYDPDPRRAWRQWQQADAQWWERYEQLVEQQRQQARQDMQEMPREFLWRRRKASQWLLARQEARREVREAMEAARPPVPEVCRDLRCGARTRQGTPCRQRGAGNNLRCRFHGGLSTGPKTAEGKRRAALNGHQPKRQKHTP